MGFNAENRVLKQEGKRRCSDCKDIFPATTKHFGLRGDKRLEAVCSNCRNKQRRERMARKRGYSVIRPIRKPSDEITRQRVAIIRKTILHDIIIWTMQEPHRIVLFQDIWNTFYGLVYEKERKVMDNMKLCVRCRKLGRKYWHPLSDYQKDKDTYCKTCHKEEAISEILSQETIQALDRLSIDLGMDKISIIDMLVKEKATYG